VTPVARGSQGVAQNALGGWKKLPCTKTKKKPKKNDNRKRSAQDSTFPPALPSRKKARSAVEDKRQEMAHIATQKTSKPKNSDGKIPK
jgi:hypothetical protein